MFLGSKAAHETMISPGAAPAGMDMHGLAGKPKQLARNAKNSWKTFGFAAERTGFEPPSKSLGKSKFKIEAAQIPTRAAKPFVRWQRARQRTSKTNFLTSVPIYRVETLSSFRIYRVTDSRLQGHIRNP